MKNNNDEYDKFKRHIQRNYTATKDMYGDISRGNIKFGESMLSRSGLNGLEIQNIRSLSIAIKGEKGKNEIRRLSRKIQDKNLKSFEEEVKISDELEDKFGKEGYMAIFFSDSERISLSSAEAKYPAIANSSNPEVIKLQDELNPKHLYNAFKYKPRIHSFNQEGVRKMIESPEISKAEKRFLIFNLDKVEGGGEIELDFKELIYNRFVSDE